MDEVDAGSVSKGKRAEDAHNPREFVSEATFRAKAKEKVAVGTSKKGDKSESEVFVCQASPLQ
ncbi:hypothetical protein BHE90_009314 [Fusarium euwallaceae]|uniref:Uncharacterized protein n=2 Tax=Fusarium solani species complex TaxID=232080 RepID=A0A3M2SJY3_9HYPO|nr:hypothetical protein CDV36_002412 [Fusarium kuroshium]RTE76220.1 hypothetical protein BHE90_009314 [Fusarium euwallaceae]